MNGKTPSTKLIAGSVAGMVAVVVLWTFGEACEVHPPEFVVVAAVGVVTVLVGTLVPEWRGPPPGP